MVINTFKLEGIDLILNKHLQPWIESNNRPDSSYRQMLLTTPAIPMTDKQNYQLNYEKYLLFTYRVSYYCRLIDNAIADHLRQAFALIINSDQSEYMAAYLLKQTREAVSTLIADAVKRCQNLTVTSESFAEFNTNRQEKEYYVILHYVIASLVRCWMEMQERYHYVIDSSDRYDISSFYASVVGWVEDTLIKVITVNDNEHNEKHKKITTCSFYYINNDEYDRNTCLSAFYRKLVYYKQIPDDTDQKLLFDIFNGGNTNATIKWIGKEATLRTIIFQLIEEKKIVTTWPEGYGHWYVVQCRFQYEDGKSMKDLSSYKEGKKTKEMVADIVSTLA